MHLLWSSNAPTRVKSFADAGKGKQECHEAIQEILQSPKSEHLLLCKRSEDGSVSPEEYYRGHVGVVALLNHVDYMD